MTELSLKEIQNTQLNILKAVTTFCDENGINYFLITGTLLGAVRHKGFIPWDDDIDIAMLRDDYEKFLRLTANNDICGGYSVVSYKSDNYYLHPVAWACDVNTICINSKMIDCNKYSLHIDIFPIDGISNNAVKRELQHLFCWFWLGCLRSKFSHGRTKFKNFVKFVLRNSFLKFLSYDVIHRKIEKNKTKYGHEQTHFVSLLLGIYGRRERALRSYFDETVDIEFEGVMFKAPAEHHAYLTGLYGDYMTLPPPEKQIPFQHMTAYWRE
ncbi:MAG: LicD family protein [Oscillospiraceae bacterium]|nr:LicD family protein [Oscillospiraceae bacterium]